MLAPVAASGVLLLGGLTSLLLLLGLPFPLWLTPMSLSTALCFVIASLTIFFWNSGALYAGALIDVALAVVALFCLVKPFALAYSGEMNGLTATSFLVLSAGMLLGRHSFRARWAGTVAGIVGTVVLLLSLTWLYGYAYGIPGTLGPLPMKFTTSLCFLLLSFAFLDAQGKAFWPVSIFSGTTPRARLLRVLVPTAGGLVLFRGLIVHFIVEDYPSKAAFIAMGSSVLVVAILVGAISSVSGRIAQDIETAVKAQQWAEMNLRRAIEGLEATVDDRTADLRRSNESLEQFARVASHDLQEPLRKIRAFGDLLMKKVMEKGDEEARDYLQRMQKASARMSALIDALLTYSRLTTKAQPPAPVSLDTIFEEVASDLEIKIEDTHATIEKDTLPTVEADAIQMRQLFQNLLGNALKFHKPGVAPHIQVTTKKIGEGWEFRFKDNGIGFEPKYAERIFQVFERLHGKNEYEGTGIGLAICKRIVDRHHGKLVAEGRPGEGATFVFTLPATQGSRWAQAA